MISNSRIYLVDGNTQLVEVKRMVPICNKTIVVPVYIFLPLLLLLREHPVVRNRYHVTNNNFLRTKLIITIAAWYYFLTFVQI